MASTDIDLIVVNLKAVNVRLIGQTLQMCYDTDGNKYDVPIFILNEPLSYEVSDLKAPQFENKEVKVGSIA